MANRGGRIAVNGGRGFRGVGVAAVVASVLAGSISVPSAWAANSHHGGGGSGGGGGGGESTGVTITNPGPQISPTTHSVSLQIQASDSNGGALSYQATGLPPGLAINNATGAISGSPSTASQSTVQVVATDSVGGATASTTFGWTVNGAYDISYPQCGTKLPAPAAYSIVGVNNGILFSTNSCLASEASWAAGHGLEFYANTGDPGPAYSSHWPANGQAAPQNCDPSDLNSTACSYDYGYNAAVDSFQRAAGNSSVDPSTVTWWLDVETGNSWQTLESGYGQTTASRANDTAAIQGEIAGLEREHVTTVGIYSTSYQWTQITGGTGSTFATTPAWLAGYTSQSSAHATCGSPGFTGGPVTFTQYPSAGVDADYPC